MPANHTDWVALDTNYVYQLINQATANGTVPVQPAPAPAARGPFAPNEWLDIRPAQDGGEDYEIRRTDGQGYAFTFAYASEEELRKLGPLVMGWLAKKEADARTAGTPGR